MGVWIIIIILMLVFFPAVLIIGSGIGLGMGAIIFILAVISCIMYYVYNLTIGNKKEYQKIIVDKRYNKLSEQRLKEEYDKIELEKRSYEKNILGLGTSKDDKKIENYNRLLKAIDFELNSRKKQ